MGELKFQFNNGAISEKNWEDIRKYIEGNKISRVLEVGCGYSTLLMSELCTYIESYDTHKKWIELVRDAIPTHVSVVYYKYPGFPKIYTPRFDMAFVDGPAGLSDGRIESMRFAAENADVIFVHDSRRPGERSAIDDVFSGWDHKYLGGGLSLIRKK